MLAKPLDETYLQWLYRQVADPAERRASRSYWNLLRQMYTHEFVWLIPNDDNRVEDGRALRREFVSAMGYRSVDRNWLELGCSTLEVLIALSRWLSFEADEGEPADWFWHMMRNLGLNVWNDRRHIPVEDVEDVLDRLMWRQYEPTGEGGLFPLSYPSEDQRKVEIWYQLNAYLIEHDY